MQLSRHATQQGPRWAAGTHWLASTFDLRSLLATPRAEMALFIETRLTTELAQGAWLAPVEDTQEVWASGVTYQRSREARQAESNTGSIYDRVYAAQRPELFFKASGWRVMGHQQPVRIRPDSAWNVPEPELQKVA